MKTNQHGIENSRDVENVYHMRLMALLQELVREKGYKGAARALEIDHRTVAVSHKTGELSRRARNALERALQEGVGSAAARQRERNEKLEERVTRLEGEVEGLGKEIRRRLAAVEREIRNLRQADAEGKGPAIQGGPQESPGPPVTGASRFRRWPPSRPVLKREYPDLATRDPAPDDEEVFGEAWPLIMEWRGLKDTHPIDGKGLAWLAEEENLLEVELALLEEHGMTLPPERQPLRGFDRNGQIRWRRTALHDTRRARARRELLRWARRVLTLGIWRR